MGILRDGKYYLYLTQVNQGEGWQPYPDYQQCDVAIINPQTDIVEKVVSEMKAKLENAQKNFIKKENKPKVLVFSVIENGLYISAGLTTDLINKAGGQNVYADQSADHVFVSYESLVDRNPEIIIIADMEGEGR